jgi:hypothetical protein
MVLHRGSNMKLANFIYDTTDHGSTMVIKAGSALGLVGVSKIEEAKEHLVPLFQMPWQDFSAMCAAILSLVFLLEWIFKKVYAFVKWMRAHDIE